MTNLPGIAGTSITDFGQSGEYHSASMTTQKQSAGFAPLETLPAEWFNNYMYLLDSHINQLQNLMVQIQTELSNIMTQGGITTPSETSLTQVYSALLQIIEDNTPIATGSHKGMVVSSATDGNVSVNAGTGVMTVNGWNTWASAQEQIISDAIDSMESDAQDAITDMNARTTAMEGTISGRAHVIALNCVSPASTSSYWDLAAVSRVDGQLLDDYHPANGDMIVLNISQAVMDSNPYTRTSVTVTIPSATSSISLTYQSTDIISLGLSNCFVITSISSNAGTMVMTSGSGGGYTGPLYTYKATVSLAGAPTGAGRILSFSNYTPSIGDELQVVTLRATVEPLLSTTTSTSLPVEFKWRYTPLGWRASSGGLLPDIYSSTQPNSAPYISYYKPYEDSDSSVIVAATVISAGAYYGLPYYGYRYITDPEISQHWRYDSANIYLHTNKSLSSAVAVVTYGATAGENITLTSTIEPFYFGRAICKVGTAFRLNNNSSSTANLCYADASGNLYAHTLTLT